MVDRDLLRIGAVAASTVWTGARLTGVDGVLLAVTIVGRTFTHRRARDWARVGQSLLILTGALAAANILIRLSIEGLADTWALAAPTAKQPYLAAFDTSWRASNELDFGAFLALGLYLLALAAAILAGGAYTRRLGWITAATATLLITGILAERAWYHASTVVTIGHRLFIGVFIALAVNLWHQTRRIDEQHDVTVDSEAHAVVGKS